MKLHIVGTKIRLNVEHRTPNIGRRILMTLRFIDFETSEPQNIESSSGGQVSKDGFASLSHFLKRSFDTKAHDRPFDKKAHDRQNKLFDVGRSRGRCSMFISFYFD